MQVAIFFSGQITWMAKAALAITQFFCASVAVFPNTSSKIRAACSGVFPPSKSASSQRLNPKLSGVYNFSFSGIATLKSAVSEISS